MAVIVNLDGKIAQTAEGASPPAPPAQPRPAPPPRSRHLDRPSQPPVVSGARKGRWWIWLIVAAAPAIVAGVWLWLRL